MDLCSDGHDEVCYDGRKCPACELHEETVKEHESDMESLQSQIDELKEQLERKGVD